MSEIIWYSIGLAGLIYGIYLFRHEIRQHRYRPLSLFNEVIAIICMFTGIGIILCTIILHKP